MLAGALWIVLLVFALPKCWYRIFDARGSEILRMAKLLVLCIRRRINTLGSNSPLRFLELAEPEFEATEIQNAAKVARIIFLFSTLPIFALLLDQQATRWVYQTMDMYRKIPFTNFEFPPEAVGVYNAVLVCILVPLVDAFTRRWSISLFQEKILLGMALNAVAFLLAGTLQLFIIQYPLQVSFLFQIPQFFLVTLAEVLVYKTCLVFAYQEAPESMKCVMQAVFMLTVSLGESDCNFNSSLARN